MFTDQSERQVSVWRPQNLTALVLLAISSVLVVDRCLSLLGKALTGVMSRAEVPVELPISQELTSPVPGAGDAQVSVLARGYDSASFVLSVDSGFERFSLMLPASVLGLLGIAAVLWMWAIVVRVLVGRNILPSLRRALLTLGLATVLLELLSSAMAARALTRVADDLNAIGYTMVRPDLVCFEPNLALIVIGLVAFGAGLLIVGPKKSTISGS